MNVSSAPRFFGTDTDTARSKVIQRSRFNFMSEAQIWYSRAAGSPSVIVRIRERRSAQRRVLQGSEFASAAKRSGSGEGFGRFPRGARPLYLADIQMLQGHRNREHSRRWGLRSAGQIGTVEYSRPRRFRSMLEQWLQTIRTIWPECPVSGVNYFSPARIAPNGEQLIVRHAQAVRRADLPN